MSRRGHGAVYIRHAADKLAKKKEGGEDPWCLLCSANLRLEGRTFVRLSEEQGAELRILIPKILAIENQSDFPSNDVCSKCERTLRRLSRQQTSATAHSEAERMRASLEANLRRYGQQPVVSEEGVKFWEVAAEAVSAGGSPQVGKPRLGKVIGAMGSFRRKGSLDKAQRQQHQMSLGSEGSSLDRRDSNASTESGDSSLSGRSYDVYPRRSSDVSSDVFTPPSAASGSESPAHGAQPKWGRSSKYGTPASTSTPPHPSLASSPSPPHASVEPFLASSSLFENLCEVERGSSDDVLSGRLSASDVEVAADYVDDFEYKIGDRDSSCSRGSARVVSDSEIDSETVTDSSFSVCSFTEDLPMEPTESNEQCMQDDSAVSKLRKAQPRGAPGKTGAAAGPGQSGTKGYVPRDARSNVSHGAGAGTSTRTGFKESNIPSLGTSPSTSARPSLVSRNAAKRAIPTTSPSPASKKSFGFVASQVVGVNQFKKKASVGAAASQTRKAGGLPRPIATTGASASPRKPSQRPTPAVRSILKKAGEEKANSHLEEYGITKSVSFSAEALEDAAVEKGKDVDANTPDSPLDVDYVHEKVDEHFCFLEGAEGQDASSSRFEEHDKEGAHGEHPTDLHSEARNDNADGQVMNTPVLGGMKVSIKTIQLSGASPGKTPAESHAGADLVATSTAAVLSTSKKSLAAVESHDFTAYTLQTVANSSLGKAQQPTRDADSEDKTAGLETQLQEAGVRGSSLAEQIEINVKLESYVLEECEGDPSRTGARDREAGGEFAKAVSHTIQKEEVSRFIFPDNRSQNANIKSEETGQDFNGSADVEAGNVGRQAGATGLEGSERIGEVESVSHGGPLKVSSPKQCRIPTLQASCKVSPSSEPENMNNGDYSTSGTAPTSPSNSSSFGEEKVNGGVEVSDSLPISSLISAFEVISKKKRQAGFVYSISSPGAEVRRTASDVTHDAVRKWRKSALPLPKLGTSALTQTTGSSTASIDSAQQTTSSGAGDGASNENFSVATWPRNSGIPKAHGQRAPILGRRQMNFRVVENDGKGSKGSGLQTERNKGDETPLIANEATAEREEDEEFDEKKKSDNNSEMPFDFFKKKAKEAPAEESAATNAGADTADSQPLKSEPVENGAPPPTAPKPAPTTEGAATQNAAKPQDHEADGGTLPASKTSPAPDTNQDQGEKGEGDAKTEEMKMKQMDIKEPRSENSPLIEKESKVKDTQPGFLCCTII